MKCRLTNYPLSKNLVYVALQMHRSMYLDEEFYLDDDEHHSAIAEPNCFVRFSFYFHFIFMQYDCLIIFFDFHAFLGCTQMFVNY